jgi:hypothetical protein
MESQMARKPTDQVKLNLRFVEALRARLEKAATKNNRSLNEEIVRRLEDSFQGDDLAAAIEKLSQKMTIRIGNTVVKQGKWTREGDEK